MDAETSLKTRLKQLMLSAKVNRILNVTLFVLFVVVMWLYPIHQQRINVSQAKPRLFSEMLLPKNMCPFMAEQVAYFEACLKADEGLSCPAQAANPVKPPPTTRDAAQSSLNSFERLRSNSGCPGAKPILASADDMEQKPDFEVSGATTGVVRKIFCKRALAGYDYMKTCAPPEMDDLPPVLNCSLDPPPLSVVSVPESHALAKSLRINFEKELKDLGCFPGQVAAPAPKNPKEDTEDDQN